MNETFDTYKKRSNTYKILSLVVACTMAFLIACIIFPNSISKIPHQPLVVLFLLIGFLVTIGSMFLMPSIKTYEKDGVLIMTDSTISIADRTYCLSELIKAEIDTGDYKGKGTRGGLSDGSGNRIVVTTKDDSIIKAKFVVNSNYQKGKLTEIMKYWRSEGFKIISNGIDLI